MSFTDPTPDPVNRALPQVAYTDLLAPFWDDLIPDVDPGDLAGIVYLVVGDAPYRSFVVSCVGMKHAALEAWHHPHAGLQETRCERPNTLWRSLLRV